MDFNKVVLNGTEYCIENGLIDESEFQQDFIAEFIEYEGDEHLEKVVDSLSMLLGFGILRGMNTSTPLSKKPTEKEILVYSLNQTDWSIYTIKELNAIHDVISQTDSFNKDVAKKMNNALGGKFSKKQIKTMQNINRNRLHRIK